MLRFCERVGSGRYLCASLHGFQALSASFADKKCVEVSGMSVTRRTATNVLLDTALKNFYGAAEKMGLDDRLISILSNSERRLDVSNYIN